MSKTMKLGDVLAENLCAVAESLRKLADTVAAMTPAEAAAAQGAQAAEPPATPEMQENALKPEDVRAVLAEKSRAGHTAEIRALLEKHGAAKLSEIDPENYAALLADAKELGDG